jgi:hypothetical protein
MEEDSGAPIRWEAADATVTGAVELVAVRSVILALILANGRQISNGEFHVSRAPIAPVTWSGWGNGEEDQLGRHCTRALGHPRAAAWQLAAMGEHQQSSHHEPDMSLSYCGASLATRQRIKAFPERPLTSQRTFYPPSAASKS